MQFGGAPKCAKCGKSAYAAEQVMGPARQIYHKPCLVCDTCSRRLDSLSLVEHDSKPFCKRCHGMQFGTRDLRSGNVYLGNRGSDSPRKVLLGGNVEMESGMDRSESSGQDRPLGNEAGPSSTQPSAPTNLAPFRVTAKRPLPTPPPPTTSTSTFSSSTSTPSTSHPFSSPPITTPRPPQTTEKKGVGVYRASPSTGTGSGIVGPGAIMGRDRESCQGCGKRVYFAEQVIALSTKWHRPCLRCTSCTTTLDPGRVVDRENKPYCKNCYGREFGPVGLLGKR